MMRSIPFATKNLLIINIILFLATVVYGGSELAGETQYRLNDLLGLHFFLAPDFRIYQLFTYMFMHGRFQHLFFNMFSLWMFGGIGEETFGRNKFIFFYFKLLSICIIDSMHATFLNLFSALIEKYGD